MNNEIKVMVVDDSLTMRLFLGKILNAAEGIKVVASASDPYDAMEKLKAHEIDVMTLDVEMPKMDGITFLKKIMRLKPMPVVMVSTLTKKGSETAVEALNHGAIDVIGKPSHKVEMMASMGAEIITKVTEASRARIGNKTPQDMPPMPQSYLSQEKTIKIDEVLKNVHAEYVGKRLIGIASSTGGPPVLKQILSEITSPNTPPIVIVQHIGVGFSEALAKSIGSTAPLPVHHALDGQLLKRGNIYIAPAGIHLGIGSEKGHYKVRFYDFDRVNRHKPSADVLFRTMKEVAGRHALSFVLTGMGDDGAIGLQQLQALGAPTYVQNEESCTVYGMPKAALKIDPNHKQAGIKQIIEKIKEYAQ